MQEELKALSAIDFLPLRYRDAKIKRGTNVWRVLVVLVLCSFVISAAWFQHAYLRQAQQDLAKIEPIHTAARLLAQEMAAEQAKFPAADTEAELFTYLRHPWPRTGLLNAVLGPLPESVHLTSCALAFEIPERTVTEATTAQAEDTVDKTPSSARDLKRMRTERDGGLWVLSITGSTTNLAELHIYLAKLEHHKTFARVELVSIEAHSAANATSSRFAVRVVLKPGFGQPGGPTTHLSDNHASAVRPSGAMR